MPNDARNFITHLKSPTSTIGSYVRHIELSHCALSMGFEEVMTEITRLTPVTKLTLLWMEWVERRPTIYEPVQSMFNNITDLTIETSDFGEFHYLANLISSFPSLETMILSVSLHEVEDVFDDAFQGSGLPAGLQNVELIRCSMVGLLQWFTSYRDSTVKTLRLDNIGSQELEPTRDYLRVLGTSLSDLRVQFQRGDDASDAYLSIDLAKNIHLRSIRFDDIHLDANNDSVYHYLPTIISQITSTGLEHIVVELSAEHFDDFNRFDWEHLDQIFDRPPFAGVRTLEFQVRWPSMEDAGAIEGFIRSKLPRCDYRGIVRCIFR